MDQQGISELSDEQLKLLTKGGKMWEDGSTNKKRGGLFDDLKNVFQALAGGAHIEKNQFGET